MINEKIEKIFQSKSTMDDNELNAIRQARIAEMQKNQQSSQQSETNEMKFTMLNQALDTNARERLSRVRIVRPDRAEAVENYLLKLISMGSITKRLGEQDIVEILNSLSRDEKKADTKIVFNRKESEDDDDFFD